MGEDAVLCSIGQGRDNTLESRRSASRSNRLLCCGHAALQSRSRNCRAGPQSSAAGQIGQPPAAQPIQQAGPKPEASCSGIHLLLRRPLAQAAGAEVSCLGLAPLQIKGGEVCSVTNPVPPALCGIFGCADIWCSGCFHQPGRQSAAFIPGQLAHTAQITATAS